MKLFSAEQIRRWDTYTVAHEPISSIDLMERAAAACGQWILQQGWEEWPFQVFCGKGNNGGDGLALARLLLAEGCYVEAFVLEYGAQGSPDFEQNLQRLHALSDEIHFIQHAKDFPFIRPEAIVIDALFGSGLNKPLEGL